MEEHKPRAHLYTRVSTTRQYEDGTSIPANIEIGVNYGRFKELDYGPGEAVKIGGNKLIVPTRTYVDAASAYNTALFDRPEGNRMFKSLKKGDHVVITKLDRGFRDVPDALQTNEVLINMGVKLHIVDISVDTSTAVGELMLTVLAAGARFESRRRGERVKEAYWAKVKLMGHPRRRAALPGFICTNPNSHEPTYERLPEEHPTMWAVWILLEEDKRYTVDEVRLGLWKVGVRMPKAVVANGRPIMPNYAGDYGWSRINAIRETMRTMRDMIGHREEGEELAERMRAVMQVSKVPLHVREKSVAARRKRKALREDKA